MFASVDRNLILASAFFRAAATGMLSVLLGLLLPLRGFGAVGIGIVLSLGFVGMGLGTALTAWVGDTWGRRRSLVFFSTLSCLGALLAIYAKDLTWMSLAAFLGMFNGMGRDRGAALVLEQAAMPSIVGEGNRTRTFAWYNIVQDLGHALGSLMAGLPYVLRTMGGVPVESSYQISLGVCAALFGTGIIFSSFLSPRIEVPGASASGRQPVSPKTRKVLFRLSGLFALDSVGGGFLTTTLLSYWFFERFGVREGELAILFFLARIANAASHLGAAWLAGRIGLVNTMVFTHIPSSLLLMSVPFAPNFMVAAVLFLMREGLSRMDVPTRQSYVMSIVEPEARTLASGVTNLTRNLGWATSPVIAGALMAGRSLSMPLFIGAGIKIAYDVMLYMAFRNLRTSEERAPRKTEVM
jgi:MFS family permease